MANKKDKIWAWIECLEYTHESLDGHHISNEEGKELAGFLRELQRIKYG